jgi:hypothetical protein
MQGSLVLPSSFLSVYGTVPATDYRGGNVYVYKTRMGRTLFRGF